MALVKGHPARRLPHSDPECRIAWNESLSGVRFFGSDEIACWEPDTTSRRADTPERRSACRTSAMSGSQTDCTGCCCFRSQVVPADTRSIAAVRRYCRKEPGTSDGDSALAEDGPEWPGSSAD